MMTRVKGRFCHYLSRASHYKCDINPIRQSPYQPITQSTITPCDINPVLIDSNTSSTGLFEIFVDQNIYRRKH